MYPLRIIAAILLVFSTTFALDETSSIDALLDSIIKKNEPGIAVLVVKEGKTLFMKGYGLADMRRGDKINEQSIFRLTSLSEPFVSAVILKLQAQGKLRLSDSIAQYLELPFYRKITIRQLLSHTSGLVEFDGLHKANWENFDYVQNKNLIRIFQKTKPALKFKPGKKFFYNKVDYIFLAQIIEKVTSETFSSMVRDYIFKPLSMNDSIVYNFKYPWSIENRAKGYRRGKGDFKFDEDHPFNGLLGADGIYSSVIDFKKFETALTQDSFLDSKSRADWFQPVMLSNGTSSGYALGWRVRKNADKSFIVWQEGSWVGFRCRMIRYLQDKFSIVLFSNNGNIEDDLTRISDEIYQIYHPM